MRYDQIISENLLTPSLGPIVFGNDPRIRDFITLGTPSDVAQTAYYTCIMYANLIQMYYIAKARDIGTTIDNISLPDHVCKIIKQFWLCSNDTDWRSGELVFSFLIDASADSIVMGDNAKDIIAKARNAYAHSKVNYKIDSEFTYDDLKSLLKNFKLFASTEFKNNEFIINLHNKIYHIQAQPFVFFLEQGRLSSVENSNAVCHLLSSVKKGDKNYEIFVVVSEINSLGKTGRKRDICCQIEPDGNLDLIFRAIGISAKWFETEEYLGDYTFLNNLIESSKIAIKKYFNTIMQYVSPKKDMSNEIFSLFADTSIFFKLSNNNGKPIYLGNNDESLSGFLFELFINYGVTNALTALLFSPNERNGQLLFDCYLFAFVQSGCISKEEAENYSIECAQLISSRTTRLNKIMDSSSAGFARRQREIESEWRTYFILRAAGIKNEKLFTDVGSIISIDDYFEMIRNPRASLYESLQSNLTFLNAFYGALLKNSSKLNYAKFVRDFKMIKSTLITENHDNRSLMKVFLNLINESIGNKIINDILGRQRICNPDEFEDYMQTIINELNKQQENFTSYSTPNSTFSSDDRVFISYSHDDYELVSTIVEKLKVNNLKVYFDKENFYGGDDWREKATREILDSHCKAMLVFVSKSSIKKSTVRYELTCIKNENKPIIPINLEPEPIKNYLTDAMVDLQNPDTATIARDVYDFLPASLLYINAVEQDKSGNKILSSCIDKIKHDLFKTVERHYSTEYHIHSKAFSPLELAVANLYAYLKTGKYNYYDNEDAIFKIFSNENRDLSKCIYPLIASVKEKQIRRDNITLLGYELMSGKKSSSNQSKYILTSRKLKADDYYCIPKSRFVGENCQWMVEPLLIRDDDLAD